MSAPPASLPYTCHYRTYHAHYGKKTYNREEPAKDYVGKYNPVERCARTIKMSVKAFLCHYLTNYHFPFAKVQKIVYSF